MTDLLVKTVQFLRPLIYLLPFLAALLLSAAFNLRKSRRVRQFLMPVFAFVYCMIMMILLTRMTSGIQKLLTQTIPGWIESNASASASEFLTSLYKKLKALQVSKNLFLVLFSIVNTLIMLLHVILKRITVSVLSGIFRKEGPAEFMERAMASFYVRDNETNAWYFRRDRVQVRTYLCTFYIAAIVISLTAALTGIYLFRQGETATMFYPVFAIICIGELYFTLGGALKEQKKGTLNGEADDADLRANYAPLRTVLRRLFGDKLSAENTTINDTVFSQKTSEEILTTLEESKQARFEAYGMFMRRRAEAGMQLDHNYLISGMQLLKGKSILFNNPFYYDFIPYIFYPMNHQLLEHKKVLIVLGRHGEEAEIQEWAASGMLAVTNVPTMWNIDVLSGQPAEHTDIGIMTRSGVHDLKLHEANSEFLRQVGFIMLVEPSKLIVTAQVGLNSLVRHCRQGGQQITFCSCDKNCDGLLDALSHILMTSFEEVSATERHTGASSYMCWDADGDHLQHRMLSNLSRYLGMGTELSFAALKNQVSDTIWYGGESFPVTDIHWIVRQYYHDLLTYANLPADQESIDSLFRVSPSLWNAKVSKKRYMTVEDESYNMFEIKRDFATRASEQGFVNVISSDYLLKDYMAENDSIFDADPKAIPCIVADYAHTPRNVVLRLCMRMCSGAVAGDELKRELMLIEADTEDVRRSFWHQLCCCYSPLGVSCTDDRGVEWLQCESGGKPYAFSAEILQTRKHFSMEKGVMETFFFIKDRQFNKVVAGELQNAGYIAENESGEPQYLGAELRGQVFQKYLPGQFFTLSGKYYEMLRVTSAGQVLVRRAADHITGRPGYRQVREYTVSQLRESETMGDRMEISGMEVLTQYADIRVDTPAYWVLPRYNDFAGGKLVRVNGIPERIYFNKQILKIRLPEAMGVTHEIVHTITILMNEVFRTLFAENQAYILAVEASEAELPATCTLKGENGCHPDPDSIYIIEDSQLDLGLLVAVRRNLNRIFEIICDYLEWHQETLERSLKQAPDQKKEKPDYTVPEDQREKIENVTKPGGKLTLWQRIRAFFRRKPKKAAPKKPEEKTVGDKAHDDKPEQVPAAEATPETGSGTASAEGTPEVKTEAPVETGEVPEVQQEKEGAS